MIKTLATLAVAAAVIAGCGSSSTSSSSSAPASAATSSSSSAPSSASTSTAASSAAPSSTNASGGAGLANNPAVAAAVASCKSRISAAPNISGDAKSKLTSLCDQAASGNEAAVLKAASQVCREIVQQSVPSGSQAQLLATCPKG
jgi:hypothetical protein